MSLYRAVDRVFAPVDADKEVTPDLIQAWGRQVTGVKTWPELLQIPRIVILAEAGSGKTREFEEQVKRLRGEGAFAFFGPIEVIADRGLKDILSHHDHEQFDAWTRSSAPAWFFLDSVDEAKLTRKSLDFALNKFSRELGTAHDRANVLISCRGSDWDVGDLDRIDQALPAPIPTPAITADAQPDEVLLSVLNHNTATSIAQASGPARRAKPTIVRLVDLSRAQRRGFVAAEGISDSEAFDDAIDRNGLSDLASRPADLRLLIDYWKKNGRFGTLAEMMDVAIDARLQERGDRPDASFLTDEQARLGAERMAAAMTLGRSVTAMSGAPDHPAGVGIDPAKVLPEWTPQQRAALLRRGVFAIATYGLVRFHHRSVQEYLCGAWFRRILREPGTEPAVRGVIFAETYDVHTVPPSLRPAAAWLSQHSDALARALIECEPIVLLAWGDPAALSLRDRARLLQVYAERDVVGNLSDHHIDQRALWMFAEPGLADAIRAVWSGAGDGFQLELLRIIELGNITACLDLVREVALNVKAARYNRIYAARALEACADDVGLRTLGADLIANAADTGPALAPSLALACFPRGLSVAQLITVMDLSRPAREYQVEGFGYALEELWEKCADAATRESFMASVADLCFQLPHQDYDPVSKRHRILANHLSGMCRRAVLASDVDGVTPALIRLLLASERSREDGRSDDEPNVYALVQARPELKHRLFWADVVFEREHASDDHPVVHFWQLWWHGRRYCQPTIADQAYFEGRLIVGDVSDRRMALSVLWVLARERDDAEAALDALAVQIRDQPVLAADLAEHRAPRPRREKELEFEARQAEREEKRALRQTRDQKTLLDRRARLQADPSLLTEPKRLARWPGPLELDQLTEWLAQATKSDRMTVADRWRDLEAAFGLPVAEAYRDGMKAIWRITPPERPIWKGGTRTVKRTTLLAAAGLALEASEDSRWVEHLSLTEIERASRHGVWGDHGYPEYLTDLLRVHPEIAAPLVLEELGREWRRKTESYTPFLYQAEAGGLPISPVLRAGLLALVLGPDSKFRDRSRSAQQIMRRLQDLSEGERSAFVRLAKRRFAKAEAAGDLDRVIGNLAILMEFDARFGVPVLEAYLERTADVAGRAELVWARLFGMSQGLVPRIGPATVPLLSVLTRLAYTYVQPAKDIWRDGELTRRDEAQTARNAVLTGLIDQTGLAAYQAVSTMADTMASQDRSVRFRQLARRMAERDSEPPAWTEAQVRTFEVDHIAPVASGADLLRLVLALLDEIALRFVEADTSSAAVVRSAADEKAVQQWLAEALELRAGGRFRVHLEKEIVHGDLPDITVSSTTSEAEVAIEVKHAGKGWSLPKLEFALRDQLAERYLKPAYRRHGVLVISNHAPRQWIDKPTARRLSFAEVVAHLQTQATAIRKNAAGPIVATVRGLDAWLSETAKPVVADVSGPDLPAD